MVKFVTHIFLVEMSIIFNTIKIKEKIIRNKRHSNKESKRLHSSSVLAFFTLLPSSGKFVMEL